MLLYHGSNIPVERPVLLPSQRAFDFGSGFYTTSSLEQAQRWACITTARRQEGKPTVTTYDLDEARLARLSVLRFDQPDIDWLEFVAIHRTNQNTTDNWDIVIGPVANDQTMPTISLYLDGILNAEEAVARLLPERLKDQYAFTSEAGLSCLSYLEAGDA